MLLSFVKTQRLVSRLIPTGLGGWLVKGSVSTAFAVWKYFSCIKKQLILCFDETKIDLKPLIMLF